MRARRARAAACLRAVIRAQLVEDAHISLFLSMCFYFILLSIALMTFLRRLVRRPPPLSGLLAYPLCCPLREPIVILPLGLSMLHL